MNNRINPPIVEVSQYKDIITIEKNVRERLDRVKRSLKTTLEEYRDLGQELIEGKKVVGHGYFTKWVKSKFDLSRSTAHNYIKVAENWTEVSKANSLGKALAILNDLRRKVKEELKQADEKKQETPKEKPSSTAKDYDQLKKGWTPKEEPKKSEVTVTYEEDEDEDESEETPVVKEPTKPRFPTVIEKDGKTIKYHDKIHRLNKALQELDECFGASDIENILKIIQGFINDLALKRK